MSPTCYILAYKQMLFVRGTTIKYMYLNLFSTFPLFPHVGREGKKLKHIFSEKIIVLTC